MTYLSYPKVKTEALPNEITYQLPKKNVLVISCIDLRLTDNLLAFLHHDNLANRYDHFILAGASLCATNDYLADFKPPVLTTYNHFAHWQTSLEDHLTLALALHDIRDVYVVEHQDCGAYTHFLKDGSFNTVEEEIDCHTKFATALMEKIRANKHEKTTIDEQGKTKTETFYLNVHCFLIDLRGNVRLLATESS